MCLAVPGRIVSLVDDQAVVDLNGSQVAVSTLLTPEARQGDWVLVHAGFAIQRLEEQEAAEVWAVLEDLEAVGGVERSGGATIGGRNILKERGDA